MGVVGIGIDAVDIERFKNWHRYSEQTLLKVLSPKEIAYCLSQPTKQAERFAARFAAKEALYKACSTAGIPVKSPFLTFCAHVEIVKPNKFPEFRIKSDYPLLPQGYKAQLTFTHTQKTAIALVVLVKALEA